MKNQKQVVRKKFIADLVLIAGVIIAIASAIAITALYIFGDMEIKHTDCFDNNGRKIHGTTCSTNQLSDKKLEKNIDLAFYAGVLMIMLGEIIRSSDIFTEDK